MVADCCGQNTDVGVAEPRYLPEATVAYENFPPELVELRGSTDTVVAALTAARVFWVACRICWNIPSIVGGVVVLSSMLWPCAPLFLM